ncbi:MAG: PAS domain-containing protein [Clostridiaceae bacterium]|nr:PAS domain-containing protein [Clostridiaceae bacterium]
MENQLKLKELRYQDIVENMQGFIIRWLPDTTILYVNNSLALLLGRTQEELLGNKFIHQVDQIQHQTVADVLESINSDLSSSMSQLSLPDANGETEWLCWRHKGFFDENGNLQEIQSVGWDITEHKLKEIHLLGNYKKLN